jgi:predicted nucleotidyltransferase
MTRKNGVNNPLITKITQLVSQDKEIALLWIYGSQADASATPESDYDLAIAFALPQGNTLESRLRSEVKALEWAEQLNLTSNQISVVDINLAPLPLAMGIIHNGVLLHQGSGLRLAREENRITSMWELDHEYHQRQFG